GGDGSGQRGEDHRVSGRHGRLRADERGVREALRHAQAGALDGAGGGTSQGRPSGDRRDRGEGVIGGADRAWWPEQSSKLFGARTSFGGFDSHTLPPRLVDFVPPNSQS